MNTPPARDPWSPDVLGDQWRARTIHLGADDEGPVEATLVRSADGPRHHRAVLYLHGFVDYFFHPHLAAAFAERGIAVVSLHPGWVQTEMGGAQAQVAPADAVAGLLRVIDAATLAQSGTFLDWRGDALPW